LRTSGDALPNVLIRRVDSHMGARTVVDASIAAPPRDVSPPMRGDRDAYSA
jgi:hypothetical protein